MDDVTTRPVAEGIFEPGSAPRLLGGYCRHCTRKYFPEPIVCPDCLSAVEKVLLSAEGSIYSYTVVRIKPPFGLPQPYGVAYVDLADENLRVIGLLDPAQVDRYAVGAGVKLSVGPLGHNRDGEPCLRYFFTITAQGGYREKG